MLTELESRYDVILIDSPRCYRWPTEACSLVHATLRCSL